MANISAKQWPKSTWTETKDVVKRDNDYPDLLPSIGLPMFQELLSKARAEAFTPRIPNAGKLQSLR